MKLPPADSPIWKAIIFFLVILAVGIVYVTYAALAYANGWDWQKDSIGLTTLLTTLVTTMLGAEWLKSVLAK